MSVVLLPIIEISFPLMLDTNPLANIEVSHYGEAPRQFKIGGKTAYRLIKVLGGKLGCSANS